MNKLKMVFALALCSVILAFSEEAYNNFTILSDERSLFESSNFHLDLIGFVLNRPMLIFPLRWPDMEAPGDYFRHPVGAVKMQLTDTDIREVKDALDTTIGPRYYDTYVLDNLTGYEYELLGGKVSRREYYVKYGLGDTVYVISGLLGKFFSFYRAIPGEFRLSIDQLGVNVGELSPIVEFEDNDKFVEKENNYIYFVESVDKNKMLRVRNYQVVKYTKDEAEAKEFPKGKYYNLIEITKFLDEEAMP